MAADKPFYVYMYRDPRPGKGIEPIYVGKGQAKNRRAKVHCYGSHNRILRAILGKIKIAGYVPIIEIIEDFAHEHDAYALEKRLIGQYGRRDLRTGSLANMTDGGDGASNLSEETRAKLSAANKGRKMPPEHGAKISAALLGVPLSTAHRAALGRGQRRRWATANDSDRQKLLANLDFTGRQHSKETLEKMAATKRGKKMPRTPAFLACQLAKRGRSLSAEHRQKMSEAQRRRWASIPDKRAILDKTEAAKAPFVGQFTECPDCNKTFKVLGLGIHRSKKHNPAVKRLAL